MKPLTETQHKAQLLWAVIAKRRALFAHYDMRDQMHISIRNFNAARESRQKGAAWKPSTSRTTG